MPTLYTSDEIAAAAERIGLCEQVSALLGALESAESPRYSVSNAGNQGASYDGYGFGFRSLYECLGTWQAVGDALDVSRAYAWRVAHHDLAPSAEVTARYKALTQSREATQ